MKSIILVPRMAMFLKAMEFYGLKEIVGNENNPQIVQFFQDIGKTWVKDDETAWCSAFINWDAMECGCERSGALDARSWLNVGRKIIVPELGHIVVFWREKKTSWKGHVGLYAGEDDKNIYSLSGNQDNMVCIRPYYKGFFLDYREVNYTS